MQPLNRDRLGRNSASEKCVAGGLEVEKEELGRARCRNAATADTDQGSREGTKLSERVRNLVKRTGRLGFIETAEWASTW